MTSLHPIPQPALPDGLDPASESSVEWLIRRNQFPSARKGRFLFAFSDQNDGVELVRLRHGLAGHRNPPAMIRCAGGLHVLQLDAPAVHRMEYRFEIVDSDGHVSTVCDPLNTLKVRDPFGEKSVAVAQEYRAPRYVFAQPDVPRGVLQHSMIDGPLGQPWMSWIWHPPGISDAARLPLVIFLDGGDWLDLNHADKLLANMLHGRIIPMCRAVLLKPASRNQEYAANDMTAGYLARELPRIVGELTPWPKESAKRVAVGCSLGALCLLHAHYSHPDIFGGLILQSGSFFQPDTDMMEINFMYFREVSRFVTSVFTRTNARENTVVRIPIHMTCGAGEENLANNRVLAAHLTRQGFPLTFHVHPDAHNWTCWRDTIGDGLARLLAPFR